MSRAHRLLCHPSGRRVELYALATGDEATWTLVALAGHATANGMEPHAPVEPDPPECQGPYHSCDQALGAIHRIAELLHQRGFTDADGQLLWELRAARTARAICNEREQNPVDCTFTPLGVMEPGEPPPDA